MHSLYHTRLSDVCESVFSERTTNYDFSVSIKMLRYYIHPSPNETLKKEPPKRFFIRNETSNVVEYALLSVDDLLKAHLQK